MSWLYLMFPLGFGLSLFGIISNALDRNKVGLAVSCIGMGLVLCSVLVKP